jgi:hypothetical protein
LRAAGWKPPRASEPPQAATMLSPATTSPNRVVGLLSVLGHFIG